MPHASPASTGHLIRYIFGVFLAAEPFPGFVHAGVRGFSPGGWQRLPPHWNYNYLSCLSNSSASTTSLAGAHTPIGSGEVRRNLCVWIFPSTLRLLIILSRPKFCCQQRHRLRGNEKVLVCDTLTKVDIPARVHVRAWFCWSLGVFERGSRVRGALLSPLTQSEDSLSLPKVTFGGCVFCMRPRRLRKPTDTKKILK